MRCMGEEVRHEVHGGGSEAKWSGREGISKAENNTTDLLAAEAGMSSSFV